MATVEGDVRVEATEGGTSRAPVLIRDADPADVEVVAAIEAVSFSNPWQPETFRSLIEQGRAYIPVAEDPEKGVIGYAVFWWALDQGELANVAVRVEHQGRGIGSALLDRVMDHARERGVESLFLEVRVSNETAHRLYLSRGFTQVGVRKDYYQKPREDARILMKDLTAVGE
jgi:ribosomal-protein-alanine N-acetyltransferase